MNIKLHQKNSDGSRAATTRRWFIVSLLSMLGCATNAAADCPSPLSSEVLVSDIVREFYEDNCRESDAPLVFSLDPSVKPRLQMPSGGKRLTEDDIYPDKARHTGLEGSVVVAFVAELDGTVQHSKIVQSSGHRVLDDAEWMYWKQYKFDRPGQLDGVPARTLMLERMNFKLTGKAVLPASFSDWIIANLSRRILQPYSRSDADALYQDLDETAKSSTSARDIQKRFAHYAKQFGTMSLVAYNGLASVKDVAGVSQYKLWYVVRAAVPKAGAAVLVVTAVDRPTRPGIIGFDFKESNIEMVY